MTWYIVEKPLGRGRWHLVARCQKRSEAEQWIVRMGSPDWRIRELRE